MSYFVEYDDFKKNILDYLNDFPEKLSKIYDPKKIVLHKVYFPYHYRDSCGVIKPFSDKILQQTHIDSEEIPLTQEEPMEPE